MIYQKSISPSIKNMMGKTIKISSAVGYPFVDICCSRRGVSYCLAKDLVQLGCRPLRAGIIPYYISRRGNLFFGLGVDRKSNDLTDFGGVVMSKKGENAIEAAIREFKEETIGVIPINEDDVLASPCIYNDVMVIIFVKTNIYPAITSTALEGKLLEARNNEISGIAWTSLRSLLRELSREAGSRIYAPVFHLLKGNTLIESLN